MAQIFHPATNTLSKASLAALVLGGALVVNVILAWYRSSYATEAKVVREQPVPFSHKHHAGGLGIDCRYCHATAEKSSFAGMPSARTCMTCHSQIWAESPMLEPVRRARLSGEALAWARVHDLPDFVHFDHSIHVARGVSCARCHGKVDEMPLMWRESSLHMEWCVSCHRKPEEAATVKADFDPRQLTDCSVCHR